MRGLVAWHSKYIIPLLLLGFALARMSSSWSQAKKDLSILAQGEALHRRVDERDEIELADGFVDEGESAYAPADERPGFCRMIDSCRKHPVNEYRGFSNEHQASLATQGHTPAAFSRGSPGGRWSICTRRDGEGWFVGPSPTAC